MFLPWYCQENRIVIIPIVGLLASLAAGCPSTLIVLIIISRGQSATLVADNG